MGILDYIFSKLPDNSTKQISAKDIRDSFSVMDEKISDLKIGNDLGVIKTTDEMPMTGIHFGKVFEAGTYTNFKDVANASIVVSEEDLLGNFVFIEVTNGVAEKNITKIQLGKVSPEDTKSTISENTYLFGSGNPNNTGTANTSIGKNALGYNLSGSSNTAIGDFALRFSEANSNNTAIGQYSLSNQLNTGNDNVAIGHLTMYNNTGSRSVGIGNQALITNKGNDNVGIGHNAGNGIVNGINNVSIGAGSGVSGDFSNTLALGTNTKATKNSQAVIGNENFLELVVFGEIRQGGASPHLVYKAQKDIQNYWLADASRSDVSDMTANCYGNVGIGYRALEVVNDSLMNTAVGYQALKSLKTGADHTAVGAGALQSQVSGVGCTAMGRLAMANATTGTNNTGLGDTALEYNITGNSNTAVGYSSGIKAGGNDNTLMGLFSGGHYLGRDAPMCTWSNTNTYGSHAMQSNISGERNNLFGTYAGHVLTGGDNAGFGHEVFRNSVAVNRNSAFGNGSGYWLESGNENVFIGYNSGRDGQNKNVSGSTVVGAGAFSTRNNEVVIGKGTDTHVTICGVELSKSGVLLDLPKRLLKAGGTVGQVLKKKSATDYDTEWKEESNLLASYTYNGNIEINITAINIPTNTFTANAHGLNNGDIVCPTFKTLHIAKHPLDFFPNGLETKQYFVINATANTFQVSLTSGGASISMTANATQNLSFWHFETRNVSFTIMTISGLPTLKRCRVRVYQKSSNRAIARVTPFNWVNANVFGNAFYSYLTNTTNFLKYDVILDAVNKTVETNGFQMLYKYDASRFATTQINGFSFFDASNPIITDDFTAVSLYMAYGNLLNGSTIEIYSL